jgi:hypothetical protein
MIMYLFGFLTSSVLWFVYEVYRTHKQLQAEDYEYKAIHYPVAAYPMVLKPIVAEVPSKSTDIEAHIRAKTSSRGRK